MNPYRDAYFVPGESGLPEAKIWLANNGSQMHPAFSVLSRYDDQRAQRAPQKQQWIDVFQSHSDRFLKALEICQKSAKNDLKDLNIGKALSWDDVMVEYGNACRQYESKGQGWKGFSRKFGRITGDNAPSVIPFLKFIPEGQYKTLFAGLYLIFAAAGRMSNRRQLILETFEHIPDRIYDAEKCCEICPTDESLQHEVMELYIALLIAIMNMMEWLVEPGGWKQIKALYQGPRYGRSLDEKISDVEKQSVSVERCIERLMREKIARTDTRTEQTVHLATDIKADTSEIRVDTRQIKEDSTMSRSGIGRVEASHAALIKMIRKMQENMETLLQENSRNKEWYEKRELAFARLEEQFQSLNTDPEEAQDHQKCGMIIESDQLLELLAVDHMQIARDLTNMLRLSQAADLSYHNRGSLLSRSQKFQGWLTSTSPIFLLVDGNGDSAVEPTSAMTFISALLAQSLSDEGVCCIHHFCGLHKTSDDDLNGPSGLLRGLLAQLVNLHAFRIGFTNNAEYHELQRFDTMRLCALFGELIMDLPPGFVLVCIIDGVSLYETADWVEDLCRIVETLNSLTRNPNVCAVFKVLATSAMASRQAIRYIPREDHLMLPLDDGDEASGPLTARHMKMYARRSAGSTYRSRSPESLQSIFPEAVDDDEGMMRKFSVQRIYLLACLSSLTAAIPNLLASQATTLLSNSFSNILPNSTLGAPVIPNDFTVRPSLPLDEPVLNRHNSLLLTLRALGDLAVLDFVGEQQSQTWQSLQHVSIDIVGPARTVESPLPVRKYALWGIYKAIQLMVASKDFHPRNFDLFSQGTLVGYVGFNNGARGVLGIEQGPANETDAAVQQVDLSISSLALLENATTTNLGSNDVHIDFELKGRTIGEDNVFMTLFTGILKAAPYYQTESLDSFLLNTRTFNTLLSCKARQDLGPGETHLGYQHLIQVFTQLPRWVIVHGGGRWTEVEFLVWANMEQRPQVIGAGILRWQDRGAIA